MTKATEGERLAALEVRVEKAENWLKSIDARLWAIAAGTWLTALGVIFKGHI